MALSLAWGSIVGEGGRRGVIEARFCINLCQKAIGS
jgi:ribosomal protein L35AE/L33A